MSGIKTLRSFLFLLLCCSPFAVHAATINLYADLSGAQEVPANGSLGTGSASITFDDVTNQLDWNIIFSGLSGPVSGAHFHGPALPGANAGVQVNIGAISGFISPMVGSTTISAAAATDLLNGLWYINLHTAMFPGGEIRGQVLVSAIPVPAAAWLFFSGLCGLFGWQRLRSA